MSKGLHSALHLLALAALVIPNVVATPVDLIQRDGKADILSLLNSPGGDSFNFEVDGQSFNITIELHPNCPNALLEDTVIGPWRDSTGKSYVNATLGDIVSDTVHGNRDAVRRVAQRNGLEAYQAAQNLLAHDILCDDSNSQVTPDLHTELRGKLLGIPPVLIAVGAPISIFGLGVLIDWGIHSAIDGVASTADMISAGLLATMVYVMNNLFNYWAAKEDHDANFLNAFAWPMVLFAWVRRRVEHIAVMRHVQPAADPEVGNVAVKRSTSQCVKGDDAKRAMYSTGGFNSPELGLQSWDVFQSAAGSCSLPG